MSRCPYSNVSKVPYHILLLLHVFEAAKMAALSHTSCLQEVPTTLQLGAILNIQVAFIKAEVTLQQIEMNGSQEAKGLWSLSNIRTKTRPFSVKRIIETKIL